MSAPRVTGATGPAVEGGVESGVEAGVESSAEQHRLPGERALLALALGVGVASIAAAGAGTVLATALGAVPAALLSGLLTLAAVAGLAWAAALLARRRSRVLAQLAVCVLAIANPLALGTIGAALFDRIGIVTFSPTAGITLWGAYPGIAGWEAPEDPASADVVALAREAQDATRIVVTGTSAELGASWRVGERASGVTGIANGYGGLSQFVQIDSTQWLTTDLPADALATERLVALAQEAADALGLGQPLAPGASADAGAWERAGLPRTSSGDLAAGAGTLVWAANGTTMALSASGGEHSLVVSSGPVLPAELLPGDFAARMAAFDGLTPPTPVQPRP